MARLIIHARTGVQKRRVLFIRSLLDRIRQVSRLAHPMVVTIAKEPAVSFGAAGGHESGFAMFMSPRQAGGPARIIVGAGMIETCRSMDMDANEALHTLGHTVCHEWAHYEQFRDGKRLQERGVTLRAKVLYCRTLGIG